TISGGDGRDTLYGGSGDDHLIAEPPADSSGGGIPAFASEFADIFGPLSNALANGLGGAAGFGASAFDQGVTGDDVVDLPVDFANGAVTVNGQLATSIDISSYGWFALNDADGNNLIYFDVYDGNIDTSAGAVPASPGGNSTGSNHIWYNF